jgi:hypothetical protein
LMHAVKGEYTEETVLDKHGLERTVQAPVQRVYEQRWSSFIHAAAILICIAPPLQLVLGLTPTSVLAGLFIFMGQQSLAANPILMRTFHMLTPPSELPELPAGIRSYWPIHAYTLFEIVMTVVVFVVTLTVAGPAFPIIIIALVPFRLLAMNKIWSPDVLRYVDRWACRDGTPEDVEDERRASLASQQYPSEAFAGVQDDAVDVEKGDQGVSGNSSGVEVEEGAHGVNQ